jgi:TadE-like protein
MDASPRSASRRSGSWRSLWYLVSRTEAAQIVELAVTLPVLVAIFVGIYDFGQAFNIKQKLSTATREGARFAANQSTIDLTDPGGSCSAPESICAVRDVVDAYLRANNIDDCGLASTSAASTPLPDATLPPEWQLPGWSWTFSTTGCPGRVVKLTVNRAVRFTAGGVTVDASGVRLSYPYQWHFNRVVQFLVPGATFGAVTQIPTTATMQNLN